MTDDSFESETYYTEGQEDANIKHEEEKEQPEILV